MICSDCYCGQCKKREVWLLLSGSNWHGKSFLSVVNLNRIKSFVVPRNRIIPNTAEKKYQSLSIKVSTHTHTHIHNERGKCIVSTVNLLVKGAGQGQCDISPGLQTSVTAAGYLADAADCRARPISDTILDTWCRGITNLRPWPGLGLTAGRCQVVVVVSNEWPVSAAWASSAAAKLG